MVFGHSILLRMPDDRVRNGKLARLLVDALEVNGAAVAGGGKTVDDAAPLAEPVRIEGDGFAELGEPVRDEPATVANPS